MQSFLNSSATNCTWVPMMTCTEVLLGRITPATPADLNQEVIQNLESIQGALLRMNRSIQAEGTFGIIKNDRWYKRIVRRGIKSVQLEVYLVSLGHNLYKFHNKQMKIKSAA